VKADFGLVRGASIDHLHLPPTPTSELFERVVSPLVSAAMDGFDGTVFAYGSEFKSLSS